MANSPIKRFFHLNIVCRDFDRSVDFYTNVVGMHVFEGPFNLGPQYGPTDLGCVAQGSQMWGVDPGEVECRFALLRFGEDEDEMMLDLLEWVKPRSYGSPNATLQQIGVARVALWVDDIHEAYEEISARGGKFLTGPTFIDIAGNKKAEKVGACCFYDPDGVALELFGNWKK